MNGQQSYRQVPAFSLSRFNIVVIFHMNHHYHNTSVLSMLLERFLNGSNYGDSFNTIYINWENTSF